MVTPRAPRATFYPQSGNYLNWPQQIYPYVKNAQIFTCPSKSDAVFSYDPVARDNNFGYGMNYWMTFYYYYSTGELSRIKTPAETIWYTDCDYYVVYPTYYLAIYPNDPTYGQNGTARLQLRHNDGVNVAFIDGHAKWLNRSTIEGDVGAGGAGTPPPYSTYWWGRW